MTNIPLSRHLDGGRLRPRRTNKFKLLATLCALGLAASACGSGGSEASESSETETDSSGGESSETESSASSESPTTTEQASDSDSSSGDDVAGESMAAFPVTITHKYGETTVEDEPIRVVSIGFSEHDVVLSLGVIPVGVRDWYGEQPFATWPWAQDELGDAEPVVLDAAELDFEQIAALRPDLILGISSGMTEEDYELLAQIAPTVAQSADYIDYGTPWEAAVETTGLALGKHAEALTIIDDTHQLFAEARAAHPEFEGATVAVAFEFDGEPGAYASADARPQILAELGLVTPPEFDELAGDSFFFSLSPEEITTLDADVIVWLGSSPDSIQAIAALTLRPQMVAYEEGREVVSDVLLTGAFSHASPLSFEYVIEQLVPELALALDGDPSTPVPSAAAIGQIEAAASGAAEMSADEQAAADAWAIVFDSEASFEDKAAFLEDADALKGTVEAYTEAGSALGGIALEPTGATIDGSSATVIYNVLFGGTAAYSDLDGGLSLVDGVWTVSRDEFCGFMASARTPCP